jgi:type IV fimbrial biogenesis protein FimT
LRRCGGQTVSFKQVYLATIAAMKEAFYPGFSAQPRSHSHGFSLVQLMITVAIVGILTGLAVPSYRYITNTNRIANEINGLLGDFQYARFAAIKTGQAVTICSSANPTARPPTCAASTNWARGWIVFNDSAIPASGQYVAGEGVLRDSQPLSGSDTLVGDIAGVTFNREGFPVTTAAAPNITDNTWRLHAAPINNQSTRCIKVGLNGQVVSEPYGTGGCT